MTTLKARSDFLRVAAGAKAATPGLVLQARPAPEAAVRENAVRVGYTASRKVGNAVKRNRAKRRLRALAGEILPVHGLSGHDYVLIGRPETVVRPYGLLRSDLQAALKRVHKAAGRQP